jgi:hypothetical protein
MYYLLTHLPRGPFVHHKSSIRRHDGGHVNERSICPLRYPALRNLHIDSTSSRDLVVDQDGDLIIGVGTKPIQPFTTPYNSDPPAGTLEDPLLEQEGMRPVSYGPKGKKYMPGRWLILPHTKLSPATSIFGCSSSTSGQPLSIEGSGQNHAAGPQDPAFADNEPGYQKRRETT